MSNCGEGEKKWELNYRGSRGWLWKEIFPKSLLNPVNQEKVKTSLGIIKHSHMRSRSSPMLQWSPSQPGWQMQVPSWHWPCSSQRGWHALWSHAAPIQPSSHWHWPSEQTPWLPHGTGHSSARQDGGNIHEKKCVRRCQRKNERQENQMEELSVRIKKNERGTKDKGWGKKSQGRTTGYR